MSSGYIVKRSRASSGPYDAIARTTESSFVDTSLSHGSRYYYVVAATNAAGEGAVSPQATAMTTLPQPPAAPTGLKVVRAGASFAQSGDNGFLAGGEILLHWDPTPEASSYTVTRTPCLTGAYDGPCPVATQLANTTDYLDVGQVFFPPDPQAGIAYTYTVKANNFFGSSGESNPVSVTPSIDIPEAPTNLTAHVVHRAVFLSWTPPFGMLPRFGPEQYSVYRSTAPTGPFTLVAEISTATFVDRSATPGSTYFYAVTAAKSVGESPQSNQVKVSLGW
jgi:pectate lyase